jgi:PAS domain S-box-containing protein
MVSPENSEDGNLPPVADAAPHPGAAAVQGLPTLGAANALQGVPLAPAPTTPLTTHQTVTTPVIPNLQMGGQTIVYQHGVDDSKRQRLEAPVLAVAQGQAPTISQQQLAAAAAQAMHQQGRGRNKKSQAQIDRRRERNRILARRTRLRKKFFFESLQKEVLDLQRENAMLKDMVRLNISGTDGQKILEECDAMDRLPPGVLEAVGEGGELRLEAQDFNLVRSIQKSQHSFVITDPSLADNPIVFASDDFLKLTGYSREQVLGRNCRFLQGTETSKESVEKIRKALSIGEDVSVTMINYTADGTPFWNKLFIAALRDAQNNVVNFIGVIVKVAGPEPGDPDHGKVLPTFATGRQAQVDSSKGETAENTMKAIEDSVTAVVAAAVGGPQ